MSRPRLLALALVGAVVLTLVGPGRAASQTAPTYVGSEGCKGCHEQQWNAFQKNPHHRAEQAPPVVADRVGCESCHGPGSRHVQADGDRADPGFASLRNFKTMPAEEVSTTCTGCHQNGEPLYWNQSAHRRGQVSCLQCHSIHHAQGLGGGPLLKVADVNQQCAACHHDKRIAMARSAHMPLREGGMTCSDCHNPHGAPSPAMIRAATPNDLCYKCHADKRGPLLWEHAPVREDCLNCHQAHGSNNDKVLSGRRPYLCQRCHIGTRHRSGSHDGSELAGSRLFGRSCTDCHSQVHGSNHPSGKYFLR